MKKQTKRNMRNIYRNCFSYLGRLRNICFVIIFLFLFSFFLGFSFPQIFEKEIMKYISEILKRTENLGFIGMFLFIFSNNLSTAFLSLIFGLFFGIFSVFISMVNGYVLGFVMRKSIEIGGIGTSWKILPHGVFELPAFIISVALGLKLGMFIFARKKKEYLRDNFENALKVFVYIVLPLLLIAGIIESVLIFLVR